MNPSLLLYDQSCGIPGSRVCSLWVGADGALWGAHCGFSCRLTSIPHCIAVGSRCAGTGVCKMGPFRQECVQEILSLLCLSWLWLLLEYPAKCDPPKWEEPWGGMEFWLRTLVLLENTAFNAWITWALSTCLYLLQWKNLWGAGLWL